MILVVITISLSVAIAVFFLANVGRERRGVDLYSRGSDARHLADMSVNIVEGQISAATKEGGTGTAKISWASQPGMIRTYGQDGNLSNAYKLYSWDGGTMVENNSAFKPSDATELPAKDWFSSPAVYTDLNAPVNSVYPIADPSIANFYQGASSTITPTSSVPWDFPSEFAVKQDAGGYFTDASTASANKLPMPVKWMYVLQDGTWSTPSSGTNTAIIPRASVANPIVGRIAFWTDDETSKVNINTASEGSYWDTPKAGTMDEMQFAGNPPARGEFQRISGHPASTSLSAVFPELRAGSFNRWSNTAVGDPSTNYLSQMQSIFNLTPRINWSSDYPASKWGGSQAGVYPVKTYSQTYAPTTALVNTYSSVLTDTDRLYASADDLWFQPGQAGGTRTDNVAMANTFYDPKTKSTDPSLFRKRLFLLTANSRAPETTLFETPRISLWPMTWPFANSTYRISGGRTAPTVTTNAVPDVEHLENNPWMTYQERLLAFCATLRSSSAATPYYFQRQDPDSPTYDWNNFSRNQNLVQYLSNEMRTIVPGMGANLSLDSTAKWGTSNGDWIALNCFDYSRSLINQYTYGQATSTSSDYLYSYTGIQITNGRLNGTNSTHYEPNAYTVTPLRVPFRGTTYTTEGSFPALREAAVVFYSTMRRPPIAPTTGKAADIADPAKWKQLITYNPSDPTVSHSQTTEMQAVLLLSFSGMNPGVWSYRGQTYYAPVFWVRVKSANGGSFLVNGSSINLPQSGSNGHAVQYSTTHHGYQPWLSSFAAALMTTAGAPKTFSNASGDLHKVDNWSLISNPISVNPDATTFSFNGTTIQVDIFAPAANGKLDDDPTNDSNLLVSSQRIDFTPWNSAAMPIPLAPRWNARQAGTIQVPTPDGSSTDPSVAGWKTEFVPLINILGSESPLGSPDPRSTLITTALTKPTGYNFPSSTPVAEPLIYSYADNSYTVSPTVAGQPDLGNRSILVSPNFQNRVRALRESSSSTAAYPGKFAEGRPTDFSKDISNNPLGYFLFAGGSQPHVPIQNYQLVTPYDTVISMVSDPGAATGGDPRLMGRGVNTADGNPGSTTFVRVDQAMKNVFGTAQTFSPLHVIEYNSSLFTHATDQWQYHRLSSTPGVNLPTGFWPSFQFAEPTSPTTFDFKTMAIRGSYTVSGGLLLSRDAGDAAVGVETNTADIINSDWDWTSLPGNFADGGYICRPDQEYQIMSEGGYGAGNLRVPYFPDAGGLDTTQTTSGNLSLNVFMPNRQVPSPVILGTLPSSMTTGWQTLNFCPNPSRVINNGIGKHPGTGSPVYPPTATGAAYTALPDHLLLDLFWMPVAEPYPISDQLSTAGKINLNYAMMPFPYIKRKSGMDAVLKAVMLTALPTPKTNASTVNFAQFYKSYGILYAKTRLDKTPTRFPINVDTTLQAFDDRFDKGDLFRSASQICDMFLYPNDQYTANTLLSGVSADSPGSSSNIINWWKNQKLTSDNSREDPYSAIYSRITTKSNTFTVHWKVQVLRKRPTTSDAEASTWDEARDNVGSELRGSTLIERYLDPNANVPDYASDANAAPLTQFYKWRVVSDNYFHP